MANNTDKDKLFKTQMGQAATIQRGVVPEAVAAGPNRKLIEIGLALNPLPDQPDVLKYMGSAAVHIHAAPTVGQIFFSSQVQALDLYRCPEIMAQKAFDDLLRTLKLMYGHRVGKLRSGF